MTKEEKKQAEKELLEEKNKDQIDIDSYEQAIFKKVKNIVFGIFSPKMIQKMAAAKIVTPELYDKEGYPVDGGLMDARLGVIDPGLRCRTCGSKLKECLGHFGYIELARPIVHIKFVDNILKLLRCTCKECGRVLIPKNKIEDITAALDQLELERTLADRRKEIKRLSAIFRTIKKCPHCNAKQSPVLIEKPTTFIENDKRISPIEVRTRLEKISDDDLSLFGMNAAAVRPEWMIITVMPIPPVTMRPSITLESGERSEDDLTHKLGDIVRINQRLFENINAGAPEIIIEDLWDLLQYHVTTYFDNAVAQLPPARHRSGQPLKTLTERIKSKEGRIRHNLAGKRTNFSARSVISPDPMLNIDEVGVPNIIAMKLTVPEKVTAWNIEYLKGYVQNGCEIYPGANYIIRPDGKRKRITDETKEAFLEEIGPGFMVERHLINGDIALFNRQPSLHRMSMMAHKIKILPGNTLRLNPCVCNPYNADFDGDEMNLHIPQTEEARAEAEILMQVSTQLISPGFGLSVMGCTMDSISGNYILTNGMNLSREDAIDLLYSSGIDNFSLLPNKKIISGQEIVSVFLPEDFSFKGKSKSGEEVIIKKGELTKGIMDKANLGSESGLMLRELHKKYGPERAIIILKNLFKLGIKVLLKEGFTIAISDTDLSEEINEKIKQTMDNAEQVVDKLIEEYKNKTLETFPGKTLLDTVELKILEVLNKARNDAGTLVVDNADKKTHTMIMANSGARGTMINLTQMAASVGQQALRGKRISRGYKDRTLSHFKRNDLGTEPRGFIRDGFKSGLNPAEFFFQALTGRDGLMDTALRTPKSGYLYRRLANAMQDLRVEYDGTVRDATGKIIQFKYGEDGIDVSKSEGGQINVNRVLGVK